MPHRRFTHTTTLEERLVDLARRVRSDVETLAPCNERDELIQKLRQIELFKVPGVAETIDWAGALTELDKVALDPETVSDTIGVLLKYQDDIARIEQGEGRRILNEVKAELAAAE